MKVRSAAFKQNARAALGDTALQAAMAKAKGGFVDKRRIAVEGLPEFDAIRDASIAIREHTLSHLDYYLEQYESQVIASGGQVHWARTPKEACDAVIAICQQAGGRRVIKGKSMVGEEIGINEALDAAELEVMETDLGEYIIQLAEEPPSHIIAPAVHKTRDQISDLFQAHHGKYGLTERVTEVATIVNEARQVLRDIFIAGEIGITGANFLIADTGSNIIVTNEGNGDLTSTLPRVHIVTASIEKVLPTLEDATSILRLLGRSATGQEITSYTTFSTGPRRAKDLDGPEEYHVVLVDNGRSELLATEYRHMLRCIRCGACLNHCPVYGAIGGHAYGWVYPGPMGSVLTPLMVGLKDTADLPNACTLNGRCRDVCPMRIPLPDMLRAHRERALAQGIGGGLIGMGLGLWAWLAKRPSLYRLAADRFSAFLGARGRKAGAFRSLPFAGAWTAARDLPAPARMSFARQWRRHREKSE